MTDYSEDYVKILKSGSVVAVGTQGQTSNVAVTGLADSLAVAAGTYQVSVDADNTNKLSASASDPVDVPAFKTMGLPGAPTLALKAGDAKLTATITQPADDGEVGNGINDINYYTIKYQKDGDSAWTSVKTADNSTLTKDITGLTNGTKYNVKVSATNLVGEGTDSAVSSATPAAS